MAAAFPRLVRAAAIASGAMPFAFALIRAVGSGSDWRYCWVALASSAGALAAGRRGRPAASTYVAIGRFAASFLAATAGAVLAALAIGTSFGPGLLVVASAFGLCSATGVTLFGWRRRQAL